MPKELTEEEVFDNDLDPLEAIREIRREEGVAEDDLPDRSEVGVSDTDIIEEKEAERAEKSGLPEEDSGQGSEEEENLPDQVDDPSEKDTSENAEDDGDKADSDSASADKADQEEKADAEEDKGPVTTKFRANGQEFEFTQEEIMAQFETVFGQAMNYTQKMQKIAPYRKMISALEQEGITHDALNLAIDALKGDKGAIAKLLETNKIDPYDLTSDDDNSPSYTPKDYGKNETQLDIEEITSRIQNDKEFPITTNVIDEQWDGASRQMIAKNPGMILGLHNDIKSGLYDIVAPAAMKMKVLDGSAKSDIEYYMLAGQQYAQQQATQQQQADGETKAAELNKEAQDADSEFDKASSEAERKRSASSTGARGDRKGVIDYLDDNDEAFDEWYKNLESNI